LVRVGVRVRVRVRAAHPWLLVEVWTIFSLRMGFE
jgi:hypothetical protein